MADDDHDAGAARPAPETARRWPAWWPAPWQVAAGVVIAAVVAGAGAAFALTGGGDGHPTSGDGGEQAAAAPIDARFDEHLAQRPLSGDRKPAVTTTPTTAAGATNAAGTDATGATGGSGAGSGGDCDVYCTQFPVDVPPLPETDPSDYACPENWQYDPGSGQMVDTGCAGVPQDTVDVVVVEPPPPPPPVTHPAPPPTSPPTTAPPPTTSPPTTTAAAAG